MPLIISRDPSGYGFQVQLKRGKFAQQVRSQVTLKEAKEYALEQQQKARKLAGREWGLQALS